jgi:predicted transposase
MTFNPTLSHWIQEIEGRLEWYYSLHRKLSDVSEQWSKAHEETINILFEAASEKEPKYDLERFTVSYLNVYKETCVFSGSSWDFAGRDATRERQIKRLNF